MIKEIIQRIAEKYNAEVSFAKTTDNFWKYQKELAQITGFHRIFDKVNCKYDIAEEFMNLKLDNTIRDTFNPDTIFVEWRE